MYKRESKGELGAASMRLARLDLEQARDLSYKGKAAVEAPDFTRKQKGKGKKVAPVADGSRGLRPTAHVASSRVESAEEDAGAPKRRMIPVDWQATTGGQEFRGC
ncbi:hypothetical protein E5D57_001192 [Metarhizium anisopliae]|nr:hypothetical protein E5D57_001192 [Metarhizium anisopliae]